MLSVFLRPAPVHHCSAWSIPKAKQQYGEQPTATATKKRICVHASFFFFFGGMHCWKQKSRTYFINICISDTVYITDLYSKYKQNGKAAVIDANWLFETGVFRSLTHTQTDCRTEIIDLECLRPIGTAGLFSYCATINTCSKLSIYHLHREPQARQTYSHTPSSQSPLQNPFVALGFFFRISWLVAVLKAHTVIQILLRGSLQPQKNRLD